MMRAGATITVGLGLICAVPAFAQNGQQAVVGSIGIRSFDAPAADWLFVQNASAMTFDGNTLTLQNISPRTVMFADRPQRMAGNMDTETLISDWGVGENSFAADPPNASLSVLSGGVEEVSVIELRNPRLHGSSLSYDVRVLEGNVPPDGAESTLFVDRWRAPGGGRCHETRWGGVRCNWGPGPRRHRHCPLYR